MLNFTSVIKKYGQMGEKSGWSYIEISADLAQQLKPDTKVSFRVKGRIDLLEINGLALVPVGEGDFILPLKQNIRKSLKKQAGSIVVLNLTEDKDFKFEIPEDLHDCLSEESHLMGNFMKLPKSHQNYYIKWIEEAKTTLTREKRITQTIIAMDFGMAFDEMMRANKKKP